jgi:hypothetical protein
MDGYALQPRGSLVRKALALFGAALLAGLPQAVRAQGDAPPMAMGNGGRMVQGTVTAVAPDHVAVKTVQGEVYQVSVTPNTRVMKGREPMKFADVHLRDGVGAMGEIDPANKTVHAMMMMVVTAEDMQKAKDAMGKTFISGTVTAIDEVKLTIKRTDGVEQVIMVDEDTSFRRGAIPGGMAGMGFGGRQGGGQRPAGAGAPAPAPAGESITLADVKVGSMVAGPGTLKNGVFVPTTLGVSDPGAARQRRPRDGAGTGAPSTAPTTPPPTTPPGMELR